MRATLLCILMVTSAAAQTVEGAIVNAVTGTGMPRVPVFLTPVSGDACYHAVTDTLGNFLFREVKAGDYVFGYQLPHYSLSPVPALHVNGDDTAVRVDGQLIPTPRISGHVLDEIGEGISINDVVPNSTLSYASPTAPNRGLSTIEE